MKVGEQFDNYVTIIKKIESKFASLSLVNTKYMGILKTIFMFGGCCGNVEIKSGCNMESGSRKKCKKKAGSKI